MSRHRSQDYSGMSSVLGSGLIYKSLVPPAGSAPSRRRAQSAGTRLKSSKPDKSEPPSRASTGIPRVATPSKRGSSTGTPAGRSRSVPSRQHPEDNTPKSRKVVASPSTLRKRQRNAVSPRATRPSTPTSASASHSQASLGEWRHHRTAAGKVYYWNTRTRETKWTLPSPLRTSRAKSKEEVDATAKKVASATPSMHLAATKVQGLMRMRQARLEVKRRRQERLKKQSKPAQSTQQFGRTSSRVPATPKYLRTHSQETPRKTTTGTSSSFSRNTTTPTKSTTKSIGAMSPRGTITRPKSSRPSGGMLGSGGPRGTSPVAARPEKERFRRSNTHSHPPPPMGTSGKLPSPKSGGHMSRESTYTRRSTSQGARAGSLGSKMRAARAPSAPVTSSRSSSTPKKRNANSSSSLTKPVKPTLKTPSTLNDPKYQEGGYLSVAEGHVLFSRYELLMMLGTGQSATVWLAADTDPNSTHQYVAIKITKCSETVRCSSLHEVALLYYIANKSTVRQQGHETGSALLINHFEHPGKWGSHVCMVFEVLGPTLDVLMSKTNFQGLGDMALIADITISILLGLDELAAMNVVHTDLKPENIMFSRPSVATRKAVAKYVNSSADTRHITESTDDERQVKISDFGLSYLLRPKNDKHLDGRELSEADLHLIHASNYTKGAIIQTREYRAPEIIMGTDFCTRTDIWSLACIVYELLTGQFLFDPKTFHHVVDEASMDAEHLSEMVQSMGLPSDTVLKSGGVYAGNFFDVESGDFLHSHVSERPDLRATIRESIPNSCPTPDETTDLIHSFITSALTWDPHHRPSSADLLQHPWLVERFEQLYASRPPVIKPTRQWDLPKPKNPCGA